MGPRAAITLATLSALLLVGCDNLGANYAGSDLGYAYSDMGAQADSAFCSSVISISANPGPDTPGGFVYAPTDLFATTTAAGTLEIPTWTVSLADGEEFVPEVTDPQSGLSVKFNAPQAGSYTFRVTFPKASCEGQSSIDVYGRDALSVTYRLRISPPDTAGLPQQDQPFTLFGGTPIGAHDLSLVAGMPIQSTLRGPGGTPTAGEVRLIADSGPDALALAGASGAFALAVSSDAKYTPLLIPTATTLAPQLLAQSSGVDLPSVAFSVDSGETVSGSVIAPGSVAIAGARLVLRNGQLPSGVGASATDGSFTLAAEPGNYVAAVGAVGWPDLSLAGVTVPSAALSLDVQYLVARVAVSATVLASDGKTAVAGARVTLRSPTLTAAATVNVGGTPRTADGQVNQVLVSAADGSLSGLLLPPLASGSYDVLIEPPPGSSDGMTRLSLPLPAAGSWTLTLQPKVTLSGTIQDLSGVEVGDVRVTAFESAGLGAAPWTLTTSDGRYSLRVDPGSAIQLLVEPPGAVRLAGARIPLAAGTTIANASLPSGLLVAGNVIAPGGGHLPSVVIDALCGSCGSTTPIATALSNSSGFYSLYLPDPGIAPIDGGVLDGSP